jgi:hypothetical protein
MGKKAFLVGINDYYPSGPGGQDLAGCVNDVKDMANTLVICGFTPKDIVICTDNRATKQNVIKGIKQVVSRAKKDDSIVFYYSGHGSQVYNAEEEPDKKDEVLCPHDMDFSSSFISDDELAGIFKTLPQGVNLEVLLDCCHSGTGTRELKIRIEDSLQLADNGTFSTLEELNKSSNVLIPRYMEPPVDVAFHLDYNPDVSTSWLLSPFKEEKGREIVVSKMNHTLWAGCRDNQLSYEADIDGVRRGIFTYNFCQILRKRNGQIERDKLYKLLNAAIQRSGYPQNPQLETSKPELRDKLFF